MDKSYLKLGISFLAGGLVGGAITWLATKSHYKKIADQEIEEARAWYKKKLAETEVTPEEFEEATGMTSDELIEKRRLAKKNRNKPDIIDYTTYYKNDGKRPSVETSLAELEHPKDSDEEDYDPQDDGKEIEDPGDYDPEAEDHEEENYRAGLRMMEEGRENDKRDPHCIEEEAFYAEDNRFAQESIFYYTVNDTLIDAKDEPMENRELYVGNTLDSPEWDDSGIMYVRNPRLRIDYEVTRVDAEFIRD